MKPDTSEKGGEPFTPPVSAFTGPIAELVGHRLLSPPARPGLLASLASFEVLRVLGGGGMGVVVLARDPEKGRDVAVKLIRPELVADQRIVHRFVKEAGHLQKLKHPNVVPVLEISDRPEGPYFVMPYFARGSLAGHIRPGQPLETGETLQIARQIADGLGFAHRHGIIHRDLKPANILLGADGTSCLADFGLARTMFNDTLVDVEREQLEGTAPYMSPGVAAGNAEDTRCDIYAFGALLYEMLTGEPPYAGRNTSDVRKQILDGPPKPILDRNPAADPGLVTIAEGAMARELRDRYADMSDVLADLDRIKARKAPLGPRGMANLARQRPATFWVPAGIGLIALGLWLMWPGSPEKKVVENRPPTNTPPLVTTAPPAQVTQPTSAPPVIIVPSIPPPKPWQVLALAGMPDQPGAADGPLADARFRSPGGIAVDSAGNLFIADTGNNTIRKITSDGVVSTLAGTAGQAGSRDGNGSAATFLAPMGIAVDGSGNIYVADFANDTIRKITPDATVTTLAGSAGNPGSQDAKGDDAHFRNPWGLVVDKSGNVYVADRSNFAIRQVTPGGTVVTLAGTALAQGNFDSIGTHARFHEPQGIAIDSAQNLYVADTGNGVRQVTLSGLVTTPAWSIGPFKHAQCVAVDASGNVFVFDGDVIRRIAPNGQVKILPDAALNDGHGHYVHPSGMTLDSDGNLYLVEPTKHAIWKAPKPDRL